MLASSKSFQNLRDDYAFFEECVNEKEGALRAWRPSLEALRDVPGPLRLLDFGAGDGAFTQDVLQVLGRDYQDVELTLLEPAEWSRTKASERFSGTGLSKFSVLESLTELKGDFDLILSHHVFYYVPDLLSTLTTLKSCLAEQGRFLAVVTSERSGAGSLQEKALDLAGLISPYRTGPQAKDDFLSVFPKTEVCRFDMTLSMQDTLENRESIMRFLVGEFRESIPWKQAVALFDPFADGTEIKVPSQELSLCTKLRAPEVRSASPS